MKFIFSRTSIMTPSFDSTRLGLMLIEEPSISSLKCSPLAPLESNYKDPFITVICFCSILKAQQLTRLNVMNMKQVQEKVHASGYSCG